MTDALDVGEGVGFVEHGGAGAEDTLEDGVGEGVDYFEVGTVVELVGDA